MSSRNKISEDPVVYYEPQVVNAITQSNMLRVPDLLKDLSEKGISLGFMMKDGSGSIKKITHIIRKYGGRTASILTSFEGVPKKAFRRVDILMYGIDRAKLPQLEEELRGKSELLLYFQEQSRPRCHA